MKFIRFSDKDKNSKSGIYINDSEIIEIEGDIYGANTMSQNIYKLEDIKILPPCSPSKIVCVGLNYGDHAAEMKKNLPQEPMLFLKPNTTVIAHKEEIVYPAHMSKRVDYEGELAVVIGKEAYMVEENDAGTRIFGYTCINDITARDLQKIDIQFTRGKGFNTFAPIGPYIETEVSPENLKITTLLNNEIRQNSSTSNLIFKVEKLVSFISKIMTLLPGDVIATGTPAGVGPVEPGDKLEVRIEGIGSLVNYVVSN
jgi:2-keto-4-pentenoate hydratase/2-oxohepta-3-ene-1,7-dioic acid hydratase in catechol pathway